MTAKTYDPMTTEGVALLVKKLANKFWKQAYALRLRDLEFGDIEQELWVTWCRCKDSFRADNEAGAQFSTYFVRAAVLNMQRFFRNEVRDTIEIAPVSAQDFVDEEGEQFEPDFFEVYHLDPERQLVGTREFEQAWQMLSPLTQEIMRLALLPPEDMYEFFAAEAAHKELREHSKKTRAINEGQLEFSIRKVMRYLDLPANTVNIVYQELENVRSQLL